jgi:hypothetical protein
MIQEYRENGLKQMLRPDDYMISEKILSTAEEKHKVAKEEMRKHRR